MNKTKKLNNELLISLLNIPKIGRRRAFGLLEYQKYEINDPKDFIDFVIDGMRELYNIFVPINDFELAFSKAKDILQKSSVSNIKILSFFDDDYPTLLKDIDDPPLILNYIGNIKCLNSLPVIGIIGTRKPSLKGEKLGEYLASIASENLFVVVSGLAIGSDTSAHKGTLKVNGVTVAVLAHGLDTVYPKENKELARKILENDGCLISEYFVNTKSFANYFVERDRIQAGLSIAILVIETDIQGGTMHTVNYCIKYSRQLFALKYDDIVSEELKSYRGNKLLIKEKKARPVSNANDFKIILSTLTSLFRNLNLMKINEKESKHLEKQKEILKQLDIWGDDGINN